MKTIKVVFERDYILIDENNQPMPFSTLSKSIQDLVYSFFYIGTINHEDYYQQIYDSYSPSNSEDLSFFQKTFHQWRLTTACDLKSLLPEYTILFKNESFYNLFVDEEGFSEIPNDFDISTVILFPHEKTLKIMFDYEATGVWDSEQQSIPVSWLPVSQSTRDLISQFQNSLNDMRIPYDDEFTEEEQKEYESYMKIGMQAAIELKKELPQWTILFHNYDMFFDLPVDEYNYSEIKI